jgi:hypothetical protein
MGPVLGREVVKGEQPFFVFLQALGRFWILGLVTGDELSRKLPEPLCSVGARYISTDQLLSLALNTFGHFIKDIGRLMHESTAAALLDHILPAGRSRIQANRRQWPASARW